MKSFIVGIILLCLLITVSGCVYVTLFGSGGDASFGLGVFSVILMGGALIANSEL